jgi:hypothetical protein
MNNKLTAKEREHLARIKEMPCSLCDAPGPSEAHHVRQHSQYLCIPLCESCHRGPLMGLHGQKRMWAIQKMDEMDCLNETIRKLQG